MDLGRRRTALVQINFVAADLRSLSDRITLVGDGVHDRKRAENAFNDSILLVQPSTGLYRNDDMLAVMKAETHHRVGEVFLCGKWNDDEISTLDRRDIDGSNFVIWLVTAIAVESKVAIVLDLNRIAIKRHQRDSFHADTPWLTGVF